MNTLPGLISISLFRSILVLSPAPALRTSNLLVGGIIASLSTHSHRIQECTDQVNGSVIHDNLGKKFVSSSSIGFARNLSLVSSGSSFRLKWERALSSEPMQEQGRTCWSCESSAPAGPFFVCPVCKAIQPLDPSLDFFQIFNIEGGNRERNFVVDVKELEQRYKGLQKFLHPDLSSMKSQREQGYSADQSARVIKAYYTLLEPLSRARYLLRLNGVNIDEEGTIDDPTLLMEIMEIREQIEDAGNAKQLHQIQEINGRKIQECEKALVSTFSSGDVEGAVPIVQCLTYYKKIDEEIVHKL